MPIQKWCETCGQNYWLHTTVHNKEFPKLCNDCSDYEFTIREGYHRALKLLAPKLGTTVEILEQILAKKE